MADTGDRLRLPGIDLDEVVRVDLVRVTVGGEPSCVTYAEFRIELRSGRVGRAAVTFAGKMYETLEDDLAALNRSLRSRPRRRT